MSFEEFDDCFLWICDDCGKQVAFKPRHFSDCVDELKERGWGFSREPEGWRHSCAFCRHKKQKEQGDLMSRRFSTVK
jgi:hypothetical protein